MFRLRRRASGRSHAEVPFRHRAAGLVIALAVALGILALRALPGTGRLLRRLELQALDLRFKLRAPPLEDPRVVNIDIDDHSLRNLRLNFPLTRTEYARIVGVLHRLGAGTIVLDVMFRDATPWSAKPVGAGRLEIARHDDNLASAIASAGNVHLAWSFSDEPLPPGDAGEALARLRSVVTRDLTLDAAEAARRAGIEENQIVGFFEALRGRLLKEHLLERIRQRPPEAGALAVDEVVRAAVPGYDPEVHVAETRRVQEAIAEAYSILALDRHSAWPCPAEGAHPRYVIREIVPPLRDFNSGPVVGGAASAGAAGAGFVNAYQDEEDGVLRRILPLNVRDGRAYPHLAFRAACAALGVTPDRIRVEPRRRIVLRVADGRFLEVPLTADGEIRIDWAGCGDRERPPFLHIPVGALLMLDRAERDVGINTLAAFDRARAVAVFLSGLFPAALPPRETEVPGALQALADAEAKASEAAQEDAWEGMERRLALRGHADWMQERVDFWRSRATPLLEAARSQKKIGAEDADAAQAALDEAETILRQFVAPHRERESSIRREFEARIRGSVCIVGAGGTGHDVHATPLVQAYPGPWVLANVVNQFLTGRFLREAPELWNLAAIVFCALGVGLLVTIAEPVASAAGVLAAGAAWAGLCHALFAYRGLVIDATAPALAMCLAYALVTAYRQLVEGRGRRLIRQIFGLFVSDQVLGELVRDPKAITLGGQKRVVTVFFSDIAGFTALSEQLDPQDQIRFVNEYLTAMSEAIMREGGYINKYIGDGIMALFGAPLVRPAAAVDAARAAFACLDALDRFNAALAHRGKAPLRIRIGLSTGEVVVGLVGALGKKLEYTAMGDIVNLGARLEAASKAYKTTVLMNEACYAGCRNAVVAREVDRFRVPGKAVPVRAYELVGLAGGRLRVPKEFLAAYEEALRLYASRRWSEAEALFRRALAIHPDDGPSKLYVERCARFQAEPPPEGWDGVAEVTVK